MGNKATDKIPERSDDENKAEETEKTPKAAMSLDVEEWRSSPTMGTIAIAVFAVSTLLMAAFSFLYGYRWEADFMPRAAMEAITDVLPMIVIAVQCFHTNQKSTKRFSEFLVDSAKFVVTFCIAYPFEWFGKEFLWIQQVTEWFLHSVPGLAPHVVLVALATWYLIREGRKQK